MTAETVMVLPLLGAMAVAMVWLVGAGLAQVRATDAAREAARALARGEEESTAARLVRQVAPGASLRVRLDGEWVHVTVRDDRQPPPDTLLSLPGFTAEATAVAVLEPR